MSTAFRILDDIFESSRAKQPSREIMNFIEQIGATIAGVKSACLINVQARKCLALCRKHFIGNSPVSFVIIKGTKSKQLFIYHKQSLHSLLSDVEIRTFLAECGYPDNGTPQTYVKQLAQKLRSKKFPHEIGLFFGYPLKDVRGFMGEPLPYSKTMGWRMYGDTRESEKIYHQIACARSCVKGMLQA